MYHQHSIFIHSTAPAGNQNLSFDPNKTHTLYRVATDIFPHFQTPLKQSIIPIHSPFIHAKLYLHGTSCDGWRDDGVGTALELEQASIVAVVQANEKRMRVW
jgi:hypothetical protein